MCARQLRMLDKLKNVLIFIQATIHLKERIGLKKGLILIDYPMAIIIYQNYQQAFHALLKQF